MLSKGIIWPRISDLSSCRAEWWAHCRGRRAAVDGQSIPGKGFTCCLHTKSSLGTTKRGNKILKMPRFEACRGNVRRQVCGRAALQLWLTPPEFLLHHRGRGHTQEWKSLSCCPGVRGTLICMLAQLLWLGRFGVHVFLLFFLLLLLLQLLDGGSSPLWEPQKCLVGSRGPCTSSHCSWHPCSTRDASSKASLHSAA